MILVDANLLVYAELADVPEHPRAHAWLAGRLIREVGATAERIPDAHLAALALGHGLTLCSADADFRIFPGLKVLNPLQG